MLQSERVAELISHWLRDYALGSRQKGFVVGISGGIDSALTSTLCALTGLPVCCVELPLHQPISQDSRASQHVKWLQGKFEKVESIRIDLSNQFDHLVQDWSMAESEHLQHLTMANTRSRLRMLSLYYQAGIRQYLVAGTGNKVEDFGVGFYTKYGDGGVDISPIADLTKTEVRALASHLGINHEIIVAPPTDGLWEDDRSDEEQIGASYPELEWAMEYCDQYGKREQGLWNLETLVAGDLSIRQKEILSIYVRLHNSNRHKMIPIPICEIPKDWR
jgi:NAD+ synthase